MSTEGLFVAPTVWDWNRIYSWLADLNALAKTAPYLDTSWPTSDFDSHHDAPNVSPIGLEQSKKGVAVSHDDAPRSYGICRIDDQAARIRLRRSTSLEDIQPTQPDMGGVFEAWSE